MTDLTTAPGSQESPASPPLSAEEATAAAQIVNQLADRLSKVLLGQREATTEVLAGLLARGHVLLEGVPGVGKTLLARALAEGLGLGFRRVQFTPDLMPTDLLGTRVFDVETRAWELHRGPVFTPILLADEINRTPPKTQAALLEAMEERTVSIDGESHPLPPPFFVIATQNPLDFEGTYPLPEAQTDRFLLNVRLGYPSEEAEAALLSAGDQRQRLAEMTTAMPLADLQRVTDAASRVFAEPVVIGYLLRLLRATRATDALKLGASPRAGLMWLAAARARALLDERSFVLPDDLKAMAKPVLRHRLHLSTEAELDGASADDVLDDLLSRVDVSASP